MRVLADQTQVSTLVEKLAAAVRADIDRGGSKAEWALVGVRSRGDVLAERLAKLLGESTFGGRVGFVDITLYRDDLSELGAHPIVRTTELPFALDGLNIVLVDDVLMTGRSVRAALQSLIDMGRPRRVWLSVLVDRGGRELPIRPDHVGLDLSDEGLAEGDRVVVELLPTDDRDAVVLRSAVGRGNEVSL